MNNSTLSDINNTTVSTRTTIASNISNNNNKIFKQIWQVGNKHLIIVDESIIRKLGITENSTFFVEQELDQDNTTILMRLKTLGALEK
jgi:hypothetical protein